MAAARKPKLVEPATLDDIAALLRMQLQQRQREIAVNEEIVRLLRDERKDATRWEHASFGTDALLQLTSSDPWRGLGRVGMRVPLLATSKVNAADPLGLDSRYLFVLDAVEVDTEQTIHISGIRQLWALLANLATLSEDAPSDPYYTFFPVLDPMFRLKDGNISWHLTFLGFDEYPSTDLPFGTSFLAAPPPGAPNASLCANLSYLFGKNSLLCAKPGTGTIFPAASVDPVTGKPDFYTSLSGYVPPQKGRPWGSALEGGFVTRYDQFAPWLDAHAQNSLDITVQGPGMILLQASVRQNDPATNTPGAARPSPYFPLGDTPAQQFVWNYITSVQIGAIAGSVIWKDVS